MLNINYSIDFIQETKKQFVKSTISDDRIKSGLLNFVDKQTELCKIITKNFEEFSKIGFETVLSKGNVCKP